MPGSFFRCRRFETFFVPLSIIILFSFLTFGVSHLPPCLAKRSRQLRGCGSQCLSSRGSLCHVPFALFPFFFFSFFISRIFPSPCRRRLMVSPCHRALICPRLVGVAVVEVFLPPSPVSFHLFCVCQGRNKQKGWPVGALFITAVCLCTIWKQVNPGTL